MLRRIAARLRPPPRPRASPRSVSRLAPSRAGAWFVTALLASAVLAPACSSAPQAPPGGEAASKAAYAAGESYAKGVRRPLDRGRSDRAQADLGAVRRALEQHAADRSSYPDASTCSDLAAALDAYRTPVPDRDPWGGAYECRSSAQGYSLRSAGEDGEIGTSDDVVVEGGRQ